MKKIMLFLMLLTSSKIHCQSNLEEAKLKDATRVIKEFLSYVKDTSEINKAKIDSLIYITKCDTCNEVYRRQIAHLVLDDLLKYSDFARIDISSIEVLPYSKIAFSKEFCVTEEQKSIAYAFETEESKRKEKHKLSRYRYFLVDKGKVVAFTAIGISNDCLNFQSF